MSEIIVGFWLISRVSANFWCMTLFQNSFWNTIWFVKYHYCLGFDKLISKYFRQDLSGKCEVGKRFEGEMLNGSLSASLLQIFRKMILDFQVVVKCVIVADVEFRSSSRDASEKGLIWHRGGRSSTLLLPRCGHNTREWEEKYCSFIVYRWLDAKAVNTIDKSTTCD